MKRSKIKENTIYSSFSFPDYPYSNRKEIFFIKTSSPIRFVGREVVASVCDKKGKILSIPSCYDISFLN